MICCAIGVLDEVDVEALSVFRVVVIRCSVESDGREIMPTKKVEFIDIEVGADIKIHENLFVFVKAFKGIFEE